MDGEIAFEFLNTIYYESVARDEQDRFEALAEALRERLPDVYAAEAGYILNWRITNAIADGRFDDIPAKANELAQSAEKNNDRFFNLMDQLAYHNQLAALISATAIAWPQVKDSTRIFGIGEFASQATDYIVFNYLSQTPMPDSNDPTLLKQIAPYMELNLDLFSDYVAGLANQHQSIWTMADFEFEPPEPLINPKGNRKRKSAPRQPPHPLCPDRNTLDHYLADLLHFINPQYYKATTTLELVPAWLRFLESRQLINAEQREQTLFELRGLDTEFLKVVKDYPDPALRRVMENWRNNAEILE